MSIGISIFLAETFVCNPEKYVFRGKLSLVYSSRARRTCRLSGHDFEKPFGPARRHGGVRSNVLFFFCPFFPRSSLGRRTPEPSTYIILLFTITIYDTAGNVIIINASAQQMCGGDRWIEQQQWDTAVVEIRSARRHACVPM